MCVFILNTIAVYAGLSINKEPYNTMWVCSSVGRVHGVEPRGRWFEPTRVQIFSFYALTPLVVLNWLKY